MAKFAWKYKRKYFRRQQREAYTMLGLTLLSLIIFGIFAIRPALVTIVKLKRKISEQRKVIEQLDQKIKNLSKAQSELLKIQADLPKIERSLPYGKSTSQLLENLYSTAELNQMKLEYLNFTAAEKTTVKVPNNKIKVMKVPYYLQLRGPYTSFLKYLNETQNSLRQTNIKTLNAKRGYQTAQESYNLEFESFFYTNE
ncbi:MAG: type 4a pilus biogenesis protein PilO [Patescibacteria group bacterium]|nr:type 4a pilus biogenesis protein PilO [Patescibacteria group bacterium]